jgi:tetratricopeptide (TPR) repeat protein
MRLSRAIGTMVLVAILGGGWAAAATKSATERVRQPLGNNPHPVIWSSTRPKPATPPPQSRIVPARNPGRNVWHHDADRHHDGHNDYGWYGRPGVYVPYYWNYYPYASYGYWPSLDAFGLGSVEQEQSPLGDVDNAEQPWPNGGAAVAEPPPAVDPPEPKGRADRATNAHQDELASKYIGYGDTLFAKQKYAEANERYRKAARSAPQAAAAWFRQGFALAAIGRYDQAAVAIKRGLKLDSAWAKSNFDLDQLFGGSAAAKNACLDALAAAVAAKPADANRLFVLGVVLHFDGQANRAAAIFTRAEQAAGLNVGHIAAFMDEKD